MPISDITSDMSSSMSLSHCACKQILNKGTTADNRQLSTHDGRVAGQLRTYHLQFGCNLFLNQRILKNTEINELRRLFADVASNRIGMRLNFLESGRTQMNRGASLSRIEIFCYNRRPYCRNLLVHNTLA